MENYIKSIGIKDDLGRMTILLETLQQQVRIFFKYDYDENSNNYSWLKEKLIKMHAKKQILHTQ